MSDFFSGGAGWIALGLLLVAIEIVVPGYVFLAFGIGAVLGGIFLFVGLLPHLTDLIWLNTAMFVAIFSFIALLVLRKFFAKKAVETDINKY